MTTRGRVSNPPASCGEQIVAALTAVACLVLSLRLLSNLAQFQDVWLLPALYFIELTALCGVCGASFILSMRARAAMAWGAGGAMAAFSILGAWSVGLYYLPLAMVLLALGLLSDRRQQGNARAHLGTAAIGCMGQAAIIVVVARLV